MQRPAFGARRTDAARGRPAEDDVVARLDAGHAGADLLHDARALVTEDQRRPQRPVASRGMEIAVTDARGFDFDEDFAGARRVELDILDRQWLAALPEHGGAHLHCL